MTSKPPGKPSATKGKPQPGAHSGRNSRPAKQPSAKQRPQAGPARQAKHQQPAPTTPPAESNWLCGKNTVLETLRAGLGVNRVLLAEGSSGSFTAEVLQHCRALGIPFQFVPKHKLLQLAGPDHRGVACELAAYPYQEVEDILAAAQAKNEPPLILLLDGIEDPHNLGAIIRTALCAGAHGIIIPKRRSAALTPTVLKTSAGAAAHLPVARVANLVQTAQQLQKSGLWLAAADMAGQSVWQADLQGPLAVVLGSEGKGVSPLLKKSCDLTISLPLKGKVASLNVSAAASAILYEICRQRTY